MAFITAILIISASACVTEWIQAIRRSFSQRQLPLCQQHQCALQIAQNHILLSGFGDFAPHEIEKLVDLHLRQLEESPRQQFGIVSIEFSKRLHAGVGQSIDQLCKQLQPKNNQDFQTNDIVAFVQEWIKQYYIAAQLRNRNREESPNTNLSFDFYFQEGDRGITEGKLRRASRLLNPHREEGQPDLIEENVNPFWRMMVRPRYT